MNGKKVSVLVTVKAVAKEADVWGFDINVYSNMSTYKRSDGSISDTGVTNYKTVFLCNGNEKWIDDSVKFVVEDITPVAIRQLFSDLEISSESPKVTVESGEREVAFDLYYGFDINEPFDASGPGDNDTPPVSGKIITIQGGPALRAVKVKAMLGNKVLDTIYLTCSGEPASSQEYSKYDMDLYRTVRRKVEAKLWSSGMTNREKLFTISDYISTTTHYPGEAVTSKEYNPTYWNRFAVDNLFTYYNVNNVIMNRILDFQGGSITCQAADIIETVATEDLGLPYLYDSETDTIDTSREGIYIGIGSGSSALYNGAHETAWYINADGEKCPIDTQGMSYAVGSGLVRCEEHQCREKLVSLK